MCCFVLGGGCVICVYVLMVDVDVDEMVVWIEVEL